MKRCVSRDICQATTNFLQQALKLAERTIQFADTLNILTDGYIRAGRVLQERGHLALAIQRYTHAKENQPGNVLASIGLAQAQLKGGTSLQAFPNAVCS